jgi:GNAT superfamily N-acetyltransferase
MDETGEAEDQERSQRPFTDPNPPPRWCFWQRRTFSINVAPLGDDGFILRLRRNGYRIGEAILSFNSGGDFRINDFCIDKPYRRRGLGAVFLQDVLDFIWERGGQVVRGEAVQRDLDEFNELLEWYKQFGFTIGPPPATDRVRGEGSEPVASLELWLERGKSWRV